MENAVTTCNTSNQRCSNDKQTFERPLQPLLHGGTTRLEQNRKWGRKGIGQQQCLARTLRLTVPRYYKHGRVVAQSGEVFAVLSTRFQILGSILPQANQAFHSFQSVNQYQTCLGRLRHWIVHWLATARLCGPNAHSNYHNIMQKQKAWLIPKKKINAVPYPFIASSLCTLHMRSRQSNTQTPLQVISLYT